MNNINNYVYSVDWGTTTANTSNGTYVYITPPSDANLEPPKHKAKNTNEEWLRGRVKEICDLVRDQ